MTVESTGLRITATASGSAVFPYNWLCLSASDMIAFDNGLSVAISSVSGIGSPTGGNVTLTVTPTVGHTVVLMSAAAYTQASDVDAGTTISLTALETALDRQTILTKQVKDITDFAPRFDLFSCHTGVTIDEPVTGQFLRWDDATTIGSADLVVSSSALGVPISVANGGTGVSAVSAAAVAKALGLGLWGGSAQGAVALSVAAGVGTLPDPLTTNRFTVASNLSSLTPNPLVGVELTFAWNAASVVVTDSANLQLLGRTSHTFTTGDMSQMTYTGGGVWVETRRSVAPAVTQATQFWRGDGTWNPAVITSLACGFFTNMGGPSPFTQVHFVPWSGNQIFINGAPQTIPVGVAAVSGGVIGTFNNCVIDGVAGQTLAANTTYYVYVFMSGSVMTMEFSTTIRATDATYGHAIKSGNSTRSLVGLVHTEASGRFVGTQKQQLTLSYFNRLHYQLVTDIATTAFTNTTWNEKSSANRLEWVQWDFDLPNIYSVSTVTNTTQGASTQTAIGIDSTTVPSGHLTISSGLAGFSSEATAHAVSPGAEGYHFAASLVQVSANTGQILAGDMFSSPLPS